MKPQSNGNTTSISVYNFDIVDINVVNINEKFVRVGLISNEI